MYIYINHIYIIIISSLKKQISLQQKHLQGGPPWAPNVARPDRFFIRAHSSTTRQRAIERCSHEIARFMLGGIAMKTDQTDGFSLCFSWWNHHGNALSAQPLLELIQRETSYGALCHCAPEANREDDTGNSAPMRARYQLTMVNYGYCIYGYLWLTMAKLPYKWLNSMVVGYNELVHGGFKWFINKLITRGSSCIKHKY